MSRVKEFLRQQIFPGFSAVGANRKVEKIFLEQLEYKVVMPEIVKKQDEFTTDIENLIKSQLERKAKLEDKAKSLLFIITLAITTATFSLNFLKDTHGRIISPVLAILSICYFVFAGVRIISAINIRAFYVRELYISFEKIEVDGKFEGRIVVAENEQNEYLRDLIHNKALNDLICIKIANLTYASFTLVRNGIILFACFFSVSLVGQFSTPKNEKELNAIVKEAAPKANVKNTISRQDSTSIKNSDKGH